MAVTQLTESRRTDAADSPAARVLAATITCLGRWGLGKTTLDDIAREAGLSRATVYRLYPGGKDVVVRAAVAAELAALERRLAARVAKIVDLEDLVVALLTTVTRAFREHAAVQFLLAHEPEQLLPHLAFAECDRVLAVAADTAGPWLEPHLGAERAAQAAEWLTRLVLSYALLPSAHHDLGDDAGARRFARTFVLPGLRRKEPTRG